MNPYLEAYAGPWLHVVDTVRLRYERALSHSVEDAFAWLTDYEDTDPERAGAIIEGRRVLEADEDRIVLEGQLESLGRRMDGTAVVKLDPPDHWRAQLYDTEGRPSGVYDYRLEERETGSHLVIDYEFVAPKLKHKLIYHLGKPLIRRELDKMWDGFEAAMDEEIGSQEDPVPA